MEKPTATIKWFNHINSIQHISIESLFLLLATHIEHKNMEHGTWNMEIEWKNNIVKQVVVVVVISAHTRQCKCNVNGY